MNWAGLLPAACAALLLTVSSPAQDRRPARNHLVRVVTVGTERLNPSPKGGLLQATIERLDEAAAFQPDIVCLPELFARSEAEPVPGPTTTRLGEWARNHSSYVIAGVKTLVNGRVYNSAVLLDRRGRVLAESGYYWQWAGAVLPLGRRLYEIDFHVQKVRKIEQRYGPKVAVDWYHDDSWFTLASLYPDLTVEDIEKEFGLTPLQDYRLRAAKATEAARAKASQ
jgi:hypothetical protein